MLRGVFITGTDTGVGKTVASAAIMCRYREAAPLRYWKPIQTGIETDDDTAAVRALASCAADEILDTGVRLPRPLSPHLAARLAGQKIDIESLGRLTATSSPAARWVVEGAGGALVPINETEMMTDLIGLLGLPAVVVARSGLGTINHTLLTLEALRGRSLLVAGIVMIGEPNPENRAAIERYGRAPVIAEMRLFPTLSPEMLGRWARAHLDTRGLIEGLFA